MVTVVDAAHFLSQYREAQSLKERGMAMNEEDERTVADLFVDQVEFANVLVVNKTDLVSEEDRRELLGTLKALNPSARIIETERSRVPLDAVLDTGLFDMEKARTSARWIQELNGVHTPETEEYGISSFVFRARRPFHPARFWKFIHRDRDGLLRSKGHFWLATRHDMIGLWSQAGGSAEYRPVGYWWASAPEYTWPDDDEIRKAIMKDWQEPYGDRRQQIVYIGQNLPKEEILGGLRECLLTDAEFLPGPERWKKFKDPFPRWIDSRTAGSADN